VVPETCAAEQEASGQDSRNEHGTSTCMCMDMMEIREDDGASRPVGTYTGSAFSLSLRENHIRSGHSQKHTHPSVQIRQAKDPVPIGQAISQTKPLRFSVSQSPKCSSSRPITGLTNLSPRLLGTTTATSMTALAAMARMIIPLATRATTGGNESTNGSTYDGSENDDNTGDNGSNTNGSAVDPNTDNDTGDYQ